MIRIILAISLLFSSILQAANISSDAASLDGLKKDSYVLGIAKEIRVAYSFRHGVEVERAQAGVISPQAEAILGLSDDVIERAYADVLSSRLSIEEAREIHEFHSSDAGRALIRAQTLNPSDPNPKLDLTPTQLVSVYAFTNSASGRKMKAVSSSPEAWTEFANRLVSIASEQ